jgi:hypothetical protein
MRTLLLLSVVLLAAVAAGCGNPPTSPTMHEAKPATSTEPEKTGKTAPD